jgi:acyl-CoA synthetase (AMP-forming)/AMP-acid ligase II
MSPRLTDAAFPTLVDLLRHRAGQQPGETCFTFLEDGAIEVGRLTYQELDRKARAIAAICKPRTRA